MAKLRALLLPVLTLLAIGFAGCQKSAPETNPHQDKVVYHVRGIVHGSNVPGRILTIEHEDVRGFMPSMTMPFTVKDPKDAETKVGAAISFDLIVTSDDSWIENVKPVDPASVHLPAKATSRSPVNNAGRLHEGDALPEFHLVNQDNHPITREAFAGKTLLLTFIFTRCPIPNFCPLMSRNFQQVANEVKNNAALADKVRLLSISFDPEFDTPETLAQYGKTFSENRDVWSLATGAPPEIDKLTHAFSVYVKAEDGTINHGLCTALVDSSGTIRKIWRGNAWKPSEVMPEIESVVGAQSGKGGNP